MLVIVTLSDCPPKLRGDLTKWLFEINTGVYVGHISARVRDFLWDRITENIGRGHATMVMSAQGEQRMDFRVHNAYWEPIDLDGLKLMRRPVRKLPPSDQTQEKRCTSKAARQRAAHRQGHSKNLEVMFSLPAYVVLDIETTGLNAETDHIIEIAALLIVNDRILDRLEMLVKGCDSIPPSIIALTGISGEEVKAKGKTLEEAIETLLEFADDLPFVCHNAAFDQEFLKKACFRTDFILSNKFADTLKAVQQLLPHLENHRLETVATYFNLPHATLHRAMADCEITYGIYTKLKELVSSDEQKSEK